VKLGDTELTDVCNGLWEEPFLSGDEGSVEYLRELTGELEMLDLVFADRNMRRAVCEDVGCLKDGVGEEAGVQHGLVDLGFAVSIAGVCQTRLGRVFNKRGSLGSWKAHLPCCHSSKLPDWSYAVQDPRELSVSTVLQSHELIGRHSQR